MNLFLIIVAVFFGLFVLTKLLEGRAKPMTDKQHSTLSKGIMIGFGVVLLLSAIRMFMG